MKKTKIDWADSTWNPVTGCLHECEYCYARRMAVRFGSHFTDVEHKNLHYLKAAQKYTREGGKGTLGSAPYPYDFDPTFHAYRLDEPARWTKPQTIFVCSMADLFGEWVPDEWIEAVFKACHAAPQHRYLFLTKNPQRYNELLEKRLLPELKNFWYGGTRTGIDSDREHEAAMTGNTFLSMEPLLAPAENKMLSAIDCWGWVIIGAETGSRKNKILPEREWVEEIVEACEYADVPLFMKESLRDIMGAEFIQEYPWEKGKSE